jgi:hypothetical protein
VLGHTYAQWSARDWKWLFDTALHGPKGQLAQPIAPFTGKVNCGYAQTKGLWFLQPPEGSATSTVSRSCTVPQNTVIFFPVFSAWADNLNYPGQPPTTYPTAQLRQQAAGYLTPISSLSASLDGTTIADLSNISSPYRVKSPLWHYILPADSYLNSYFGQTWPAGTTTPPPGAVADRVYVALEPLSVGTHTINWSGSGTSINFSDTYTITVP